MYYVCLRTQLKKCENERGEEEEELKKLMMKNHFCVRETSTRYSLPLARIFGIKSERKGGSRPLGEEEKRGRRKKRPEDLNGK